MDNVDTTELTIVLQKFSSYINSLCRKFYIVGGTADDMFEEGVIGLLQACKNYSGKSLLDDKFEPFAKVCIKRQIIDAVKKSNPPKNKALNDSVSLTNIDSDGEETSLLNSFVDRNTSNDPLDLFIDKEKIEERLKICDCQLSELEKQVLSHYLSGEKQTEIAEKLEKSVKSIDSTLQRIKAKLK